MPKAPTQTLTTTGTPVFDKTYLRTGMMLRVVKFKTSEDIDDSFQFVDLPEYMINS